MHIASPILLSLLLILLNSVSTNAISRPPTLGRSLLHRKKETDHLLWLRKKNGVAVKDEADLKTYFYNQTLDHFNFLPESFATFQQKYLINSKYWGGPNQSAPIFAFLGAEDPLGYPFAGVLQENAKQFKALLVYIEHRYYGDSIPFGSRKEAFSNASTLGYFTSTQAIADYAEILMHIKEKLHAHNSPIIVVGGSYGGMLAAWFRLKYPHIVLGALASSAPVLYFDDITPNDAFDKVVTRDFQEESFSCYETIKRSWDELDRVASLPNGLAILSQKFNTCSPLTDVLEFKNALEDEYSFGAQYSSEIVKLICQGIDSAPKDSDILTRITAGITAGIAAKIATGYGNTSCLSISYDDDDDVDNETDDGWSWQTCTELVMPFGRGNETMYFPMPFNITEFIQNCMESYGVQPRPHWVTTYYGGHDMKLVFQRFGSNIIFSNGLKDPFSSGGVLEDLSESLVAIKTEKGTHCMDLYESRPTDPKWLVKQREKEVGVIRGWLNKYYKDLQNVKD